MNHSSHRQDILVGASLRAGSKARRARPLTLLLSGLILIAAIASAAAEQTNCERVLSIEGSPYGAVQDCLEEQAAAEEAALKAKEAAAKAAAKIETRTSPPRVLTWEQISKGPRLRE